jgi:cystathionine beta-synthase
VVILPDSGSRYLSKFFDDKWMREFGFLSMEFGEMTLGDLLIAKPDKVLYTATLGDSIRKVVAVMHQHGISQMPVVGKKARWQACSKKWICSITCSKNTNTARMND